MKALAEAGFHRVACAQAYYAAFYAVEEAQASRGEKASKSHGGAVAAFGRMAKEVGDDEAGRLFTQLRARRERIHYEHQDATAEEAQRRIAAAERVIAVVERFLAQPPS